MGSSVTLAPNAAPLNITLDGPNCLARLFRVSGESGVGAMEAYGDLTDEELATLLSFVRKSWGNQASDVTPKQVSRQR